MILNGPNLNLLGVREPHIYGATTLAAIETSCREFAQWVGVSLELHQSNHEGALVDWIQSARETADALIMPATNGRTRFLARVAGNTLDIVLRDLALGNRHRQRQLERLRALLGEMGDLAALRWSLVQRLRDNAIALDHPGLAETLREAVVNQVAIDQPNYSGLKRALANAAPEP